MASTALTIESLAAAGAEIIEIGVPFSDPIADGPVIAEAMKGAIEHGATPPALFAMLAEVRPKVDAALILMVSASIVERIGRAEFISKAKAAGADGLIVPDLDLDEAPDLAERCGRAGLDLTLLVAPATGRARLERIASLSRGFIYLLSRQGVTGAAASHGASESGGSSMTVADDDLARRVAEVRHVSRLPIACGFGISSAIDVKRVTKVCEGAIVGSALVRAMAEAKSPEDAAARATALYRSLRGA